jgi:hypothetical protein
MGRSQRSKGQRGEREAASAWRVVYPDARRGSQSRSGRDSADVEGTPWWLEVKTLARIAAIRHLEQAEAATDGRPCVVRLREDRDRQAVVLLREELFLEILARLGGAV